MLEKYKVSNVGVYESEHPLWAIWDEIDNGRPAICFVRGLTQRKNDQEVLSFLIDNYEVRDQSLLYKYYNHADIRRDFQEYFVSVKFQHIDANTLFPDAYYNWALFDPNYSSIIKKLSYPYSLLAPPSVNKLYKELVVLKTIQ